MPTHKCRADAEQSRVRVAVLGQPRGQQRNSLGPYIPAIYCIFRRNTAAYRMQRVVAAVQEWSRHCWNESVSLSSIVSSPQPPLGAPQTARCQKPGDAELCAGSRCFCLYNSHHAIMVITTPWLQFTGHQPKRKRAELACTICHGKKVPIRVCLGRTWTEKSGRSAATSKSAPARASATAPTATRPVRNVA